MRVDKTVNVQARVRITSLATLLAGYERRGFRIRSKSDLLWQAVEDIVKTMIGTGDPAFEDVQEAASFLQQNGISMLSNPRLQRQLQNAIVTEHMEKEGIDPIYGLVRVTTGSVKKSGEIDYDELYQAAAKYAISQGDVPITKEEFMRRLHESDISPFESPLPLSVEATAMPGETPEDMARLEQRRIEREQKQKEQLRAAYTATPKEQ